MYALPLPGVDDPEGQAVPDGGAVVDAHVHLFPDKVFLAIWDWFDHYAWPVRYRLTSPEILQFLLSKGVQHVVGLHYAHKPGMAASLNRYMAGLCAEYPQLTGTATVFPGEDGTRKILEEGFEMGLSGVKLHAHVQCFHLDSPEMHEIYEACMANDKPLVMHVGREPKSYGYLYSVDPYVTCNSGKLERVLRDYPDLRICVPHLGADEYQVYQGMLERYDNLWLDIAMSLADYIPSPNVPRLGEMRHERILYGTDFPNIPYAWDRELKKLQAMSLSSESLERILEKNCIEFYSIKE